MAREVKQHLLARASVLDELANGMRNALVCSFRITERINYDRRRLTENGEWVDRVDMLPPYIIQWRNSRPSYKKL